jgi:D-alanyl-D-alanine carboxypeptidase
VSALEHALPILDAWVENAVLQNGLPSVGLALVQGERLLWRKAWGWADIAAGVVATAQTPYRIGSITKTFTALAALQLRDEGRLRLDDRVRDYVSSVAHHARSVGVLDVTIRELLTHTSGLQRDLPGTWWTVPEFPAEIPGQLNATYQAATEWKYSNVGYALLGEVIAAAGGESWAQRIARCILEPLGMAATRAAPAANLEGLATGYSRPKAGAAHVAAARFDFGALGPAGGIVSTLEDMARYLAFSLNGAETVLAARSLREMQRPHWLMDDWQTAWGLGVRLRRAEGRVRIGHAGMAPGFSSLIEFIPALKLGVVALTNADDGNPAAFCDYALQLLSPIVARGAARPGAASGEEALRYCGRYRSENGNLTMLVALLDGQLSLLPPGAPNPYAARMILDPAGEPHSFVLRAAGAFSMLPAGERFSFTMAADGTASGYLTPGARYTRDVDSRPGRRAEDHAVPYRMAYTGVERRKGSDRRGLPS